MNPNEAIIQALREALQSAPENLPLRRHLADLLMEAGGYEEAAQQYRQALDGAPQDAGLKLCLARAYERQGKEDIAYMVMEDFLHGPEPSAADWIAAARLYLELSAGKHAALAYRRGVAADPALADPELEANLPAEKIAAEKTDPLFVVAEEADGGPVVEVEHPKIDFKDVGGMDKLKEEIRMKIIYPSQHPELFKAYGKAIGGGILMYGPPGCGKTYLARATAGEVKASFISIGLHEVLDMYIGQSEQNLHRIFQTARSKTPCVLFIDEVDALGANRSDMRHNALRQVINQFLAEMDGVDTSNEGVLVLAATNTPWYVDVALRRPGRFDRVLYVPPPDQPARESILRIQLAGKPVQGVDFPRLARETRDFSGADLRGLVDAAVELKLREAMKTGSLPPLTTNDLLAALKNARPTTREWFETARNYAVYANEGGIYDDILDYLKLPRGKGPMGG